MTTIAISFDWEPAGGLSLDARVGLLFPVLPAAPRLYRFWIESADPRPGVYVGEATDLRRRMQHYRTPGPSQATNLRVNALVKEAVLGGAVVTVSIATRATLRRDAGDLESLDLGRRTGRLIAEQLAIAAAALEDVSDPGGEPVHPRILDRPGVGESEYE